MIFSAEDFNSIVLKYGVQSKIIKIEELQNNTPNTKNMRLIYLMHTSDQQKLVCRMTNEVRYPSWLIEKQSAFAMFLYKNGIPTAKKFKCNNNYCIQWKKEKLNLFITLETYAGKDLENVNLSTFRKFGELLGRIHAISQIYPYRIGFSFTIDAIRKERAKYKNLLTHVNNDYLCRKEIHKAARLHDALIHILNAAWPYLPQGVVHGDLGIFNNVLVSRDIFTIIDFHLSCDEAYLFDLMASFYSSFYKFCRKTNFDYTNSPLLLRLFLNGYTKYRKLTRFEEQNFEAISSLMNGIFCTKYIIEKCNRSLSSDDAEHFNYIANIFIQGINCYESHC